MATRTVPTNTPPNTVKTVIYTAVYTITDINGAHVLAIAPHYGEHHSTTRSRAREYANYNGYKLGRFIGLKHYRSAQGYPVSDRCYRVDKL